MWYEACDNPRALRELYTSGDGLERVEMFGVTLHREGTRLGLRIQLPRFPDHPPARWDPHASAVQVTVDFWFVRDLQIEGWGHSNVGVLSLVREEDGLRVTFDSDAARLSARCDAARIDGFSAYTDETAGDAP